MRLARSLTSVVIAAIAPIASTASAETVAPTTSGSPSAISSTSAVVPTTLSLSPSSTPTSTPDSPDPGSAARRLTTLAASEPASSAPGPTGGTSTMGPSSTPISSPTSIVGTTQPAAGPHAPPRPRLVPLSPSVSMAFTGDALWHSPLWRQARANYAAHADHTTGSGFDFQPMLAGLAPVVNSVDVGVCHLETPIAPEGENYSTAPLYGVPAEVAGAIAAAGFDRCSAASNHTADRGGAGVDRTVGVLNTHGLGVSGIASTPRQIQPQVFVEDGLRITHLSYTFSYNGLSLPAGEEWRSAVIEPARIIADARVARVLGAQVVVVSLHWGVEGVATPSEFRRTVAEQITAPGHIDVIVGHHAHVLQPIERVNGVWVLFGLGNIVSNLPTSSRWPAATQDGAVAVVSFDVAADGTVMVGTPVIHPTWVDRDAGWIVRLVQPTLEDPAIGDGLRAQLDASLARTQSVVGNYVAG